jgi:hypothetical protein
LDVLTSAVVGHWASLLLLAGWLAGWAAFGEKYLHFSAAAAAAAA